MHKHHFIMLTFWLSLITIMAPMMAGESSIQRLGGYTLPRTHDFLIQSRDGRDYRIFVAEPAAKAPPEGFPVLYVLDANSCFGTVAEAQRILARHASKTGVVPMLIVGIGYPGDKLFNSVRRTLDYTIPAATATLPPRRDGSDWPSYGGADAFLHFIQNNVKPLVDSRFSVNEQHQAIFGHSFGGLFVLHTLFTRPDTFQYYIASSPSVWWGDYALLSEEKAFRQRCRQSAVNVHLKVTTAELEQGHGPAANLPPTPSSIAFGSSKEMSVRLAKFDECGLAVTFHEFPNENHGSVMFVAISRALQFASGTQQR